MEPKRTGRLFVCRRNGPRLTGRSDAQAGQESREECGCVDARVLLLRLSTKTLDKRRLLAASVIKPQPNADLLEAIARKGPQHFNELRPSGSRDGVDEVVPYSSVGNLEFIQTREVLKLLAPELLQHVSFCRHFRHSASPVTRQFDKATRASAHSEAQDVRRPKNVRARLLSPLPPRLRSS